MMKKSRLNRITAFDVIIAVLMILFLRQYCFAFCPFACGFFFRTGCGYAQ